jgi:hypothetical protein
VSEEAPAELLETDAGPGRGSAVGLHHRQRLGRLALGHCHQAEGAVVELDERVVALPHAQQRRIPGNGAHGEPVGMGDRQAMAAQGQPERRVGGRVDDPKPDPSPGRVAKVAGARAWRPLARYSG